jgi:hypothetical protein
LTTGIHPTMPDHHHCSGAKQCALCGGG